MLFLTVLCVSTTIQSLEQRTEEEVTQMYTSLYMETHSDKPYDVDANKIDDCSVHGEVRQGSKRDTIERINFVRYLAGLKPVTYETKYDAAQQELAHVFYKNQRSDHDISGMTCASPASIDAAKKSNIHMNGYFIQPAETVDYYMFDIGSGNENVGHRRWILSPTLKKISIGAYGNTGKKFFSAHALRVIDDDLHGNTCDVPFIAWPAPGPFPRHLIPDRWSFTLVQGSLEGQTVTHSIDIDGTTSDTVRGKVFTSLSQGKAPATYVIEAGSIKSKVKAAKLVTVTINIGGTSYKYAFKPYDSAVLLCVCSSCSTSSECENSCPLGSDIFMVPNSDYCSVGSNLNTCGKQNDFLNKIKSYPPGTNFRLPVFGSTYPNQKSAAFHFENYQDYNISFEPGNRKSLSDNFYLFAPYVNSNNKPNGKTFRFLQTWFRPNAGYQYSGGSFNLNIGVNKDYHFSKLYVDFNAARSFAHGSYGDELTMYLGQNLQSIQLKNDYIYVNYPSNQFGRIQYEYTGTNPSDTNVFAYAKINIITDSKTLKIEDLRTNAALRKVKSGNIPALDFIYTGYEEQKVTFTSTNTNAFNDVNFAIKYNSGSVSVEGKPESVSVSPIDDAAIPEKPTTPETNPEEPDTKPEQPEVDPKPDQPDQEPKPNQPEQSGSDQKPEQTDNDPSPDDNSPDGSIGADNNNNPKKTNVAAIVVPIVLAVVVIGAVVGFFVYTKIFKKNENSIDENAVPTSEQQQVQTEQKDDVINV